MLELPQNIFGLLLVLITNANRASFLADGEWSDFYIARRFRGLWGISLGRFVVFGHEPTIKQNRHERGHQKQSKKYGWFYLILVGLPSLACNIWDKIAHRKWDLNKRYEWYYSKPFEKEADYFGRVNRWT